MKRLTVILMTAVLMTVFLTGCGKNRLLYNKVNLEDYVEVSDYLGIEVDTASDTFAEYYAEVLSTDVTDYSLYKQVNEGTVANGDIANINYVGKIDGVEFEGGSAEGYDLTIGSGTFIDDFEEELIGVAVGETKDVTATFPDNYTNNTDLSGKEAIFTVTVNYIKVPLTPAEAYSDMGFDSVDDYVANITKRAVQAYIIDTVCGSANVIAYPEEDSELLCESIYEYYVDAYASSYNVNLEELIVANGSTVDEYKEKLATNMVPQMMNTNMVMYYILDAENLEIYESTLESQGVDQAVIAESYTVQDIVIEYLYDNAVIK